MTDLQRFEIKDLDGCIGDKVSGCWVEVLFFDAGVGIAAGRRANKYNRRTCKDQQS